MPAFSCAQLFLGQYQAVMKNILCALMLSAVPFCGNAIIRCNRPVPVLHSIADKHCSQLLGRLANAEMPVMVPQPDSGPVYKFKHNHGGYNGEKYQKLQDLGIVFCVVGVIVGALGGMWVKSENDEAERQRNSGSGHVFNGLNQMAAGFVLAIGIGLTCAGIPILLTHL
jgi:hypothetical protein